MLHRVNAVGTIDPASEMHYRFHQKVDLAIYPQVHDFYEITLITQGNMRMTVNEEEYLLKSGCLLLIRPGDVHSRSEIEKCAYINLAFPANVIEEMFQYLDIPYMQKKILTLPRPPKAALSLGETLLLKAQLENLNLLPAKEYRVINVELRRLLLDIMLQYFLPIFFAPKSMLCPSWFNSLMEKLEEPEMFASSLDELARIGGCTKEHLCRSFRKYLGVSPTAYLNAKRLNYAANMLVHSDAKVIDIAYASGFQSLSRFYHAFKKEFQTTPLEYRKRVP